MEIIAAKGVYLLEGCTPALRHLPKRAGFTWHAGPHRDPSWCAACAAGAPTGRWFAVKEERVLDLAIVIAKTPGEPALDLRNDAMQAKAARAIAEAVGQVDWLTRLDSRHDD